MPILSSPISHVPFTPTQHRTSRTPIAVLVPLLSSITLAVSLAVTLSPPLGAQLPEKFTIRQALSAPFPTELVASPKGDAVAWIFDEQGANNVWVSDAPRWVGRSITHFPAETGLEISTPHWTPDGRSIVFVRGSAPNDRGEYANPAHDPRGTRRVIMIATADGRTVREVAEGASPQVAPDGRSIAFLRRGDVWTASLVDSAAPSQLFASRGSAGNLRWSPDGSAIAFTSARGDHGFVGVFDVRARRLTYLDPSVDRDGAPIWSPDGKRVAFVRQPADTREPVHLAKRTGMPWSIRVVDVATGKGTEIWRAHAGAGSVFHPLAADDQLAWSADGRIVFPWEESGWAHLYSVAVSGGAAMPLMSGAFEVEDAALARDGRTMIYSCNQGDIDRRHLWSVSTAGGPQTELTPGTGIEWEPVSLENGAVGLLRSDALSPARPAILRAGTVADLADAAIPADFPRAQLVVPRQVIFKSEDGLTLHGQIFLPPNESSGRHPAIVFYHGGSRRQMMLGWHPMGYYHNAYALNQYLASRGYVVLSVNYRSGIGYGLDFREALDYGPRGGTEGRDAIAAARYLKTRPDVDASRIGAWGGSYGGYMTAMSLARAPESYKVGVDFAGVHDWNLEYDRIIDTWDEAREMAARRLAYSASPMSDLSHWRAPVLLVQGDDDRNVVFAQTVQLAEDLRKRGVHVETLVYPDETHEWLLHEHWVQSYERTAEFLERYLR